jgi:hypothetical protein
MEFSKRQVEDIINRMILDTGSSRDSKRRSVVISFMLWSLVVAPAIAWHWQSLGMVGQAVRRSGLFVVLMLLAHGLGYRLYLQQPLRWSPRYQALATEALFQQLIVFALATCILDGGYLASMVLSTFAGFWVGVVAIVCLRPAAPTKSDVLYMRLASLVLLGITALIYTAVLS